MSVATALSFEDAAFEEAGSYEELESYAGFGGQRRLATVTQLYVPRERSVAPPLRLTRRGVVVLAGLVGLIAAALIGIAWASAPSAAGNGAGAGLAAANVSVQQGDSLWSIAARVAPNTDPRVEVERLQSLNHLSGVTLQPGQLLRTR